MTKLIRYVHTVTLLIIFVGILFFIGTAITLIVSLLLGNRQKYFHRAAQIWSRLMVAAAGIKVSVEGLDNLPRDRAVILAANHQSVADIPILLAFLPGQFRFIVKREFFKTPLLGWYIKQTGYPSIDRREGRSAHQTLEEVTAMVRGGTSVLIFPEGTRSTDGNLQEFKRGAVSVALGSGADLIPVAISGSYAIMPRKSYVFYPQKVTLKIGTPLTLNYPRIDKEAYNAGTLMLHEAIRSML